MRTQDLPFDHPRDRGEHHKKMPWALNPNSMSPTGNARRTGLHYQPAVRLRRPRGRAGQRAGRAAVLRRTAVGYRAIQEFLERTGTGIVEATFLPADEIGRGSGYLDKE